MPRKTNDSREILNYLIRQRAESLAAKLTPDNLLHFAKIGLAQRMYDMTCTTKDWQDGQRIIDTFDP